jgi:exocyst complex component 8
MFRKQVYSSDAEQKTVEEALKITHSQSRKVCSSNLRATFPRPWCATIHLHTLQLLQEFGLDFRFLLDELLVQNPQINDASVISATFSPPSRGLPVSRSQTPQPTSSIVSLPIPSPSDSPARSITRSPIPVLQVTHPRDSDHTPKPSCSSPAPPPRSSNRPGSTTRPPPVAIPPREGMF